MKNNNLISRSISNTFFTAMIMAAIFSMASAERIAFAQEGPCPTGTEWDGSDCVAVEEKEQKEGKECKDGYYYNDEKGKCVELLPTWTLTPTATATATFTPTATSTSIPTNTSTATEVPANTPTPTPTTTGSSSNKGSSWIDDILSGIGGAIFEPISNWFSDTWRAISTFIVGVAVAAWAWTSGAAKTAWNWTKGAANTTWNWTKNTGNKIGNAVEDGWNEVKSWF